MRYVFYVTDQGVTAYQSSGASENRIEDFDWKDNELLDSYLSSMEEDAQADVILDLVDEDLHFEWSPKVHSWEKQSIRKRRKTRLQTENIALAEVKWVGASKVSEEGRKEELLLAATVADSFNLTTFLQSLEDAQVIIENIYSKAYLLESYFKKKVRSVLHLSRQDIKKPFLMVSRQSENVFRQTFMIDGELRLSRLVELDDSYHSVEEIRKALLAETKLAIAYVYNQKILPFNSPVGFVFLDGEQKMLDGIIALCQEEGLIRSTWDEKEFFVGTANFRNVSSDGVNCQLDYAPCYSKQAAVDFVLSDRPQGFYSNVYVNKINGLIIGRNSFIGINIIVFLFGLYYVLVTGVDTLLSWQKQAMLEQKIQQHELEKKRLQKMVELQDDAQRIKASVEFSEAVLKLKVNRLISFDINAVSAVFANNSNIQLSDINWKTIDRFDSRRNQIDIKAWVFPFYETYHDPVMWVDKFVSELKSVEGVESIQLQKEPLNRRLNQALVINTNAGDVKALPFTVTLRIKDVESK